MRPQMTGYNSDELDDDDIILGLMDKDEDALRALLEKYGGTIRVLVRKKFGDILQGPELEEVLTRTAHKVWRYAGSYDEKKASLKGWVLFIAVREAQTILRETKKQRHLQLDDEIQVERGFFDCDPPDVEKKERKVLGDMREAIDGLPPLQKAIIEADLRSGDVADASRLAQIHGTSKNSIYVSRNKAREKIRQELIRRGHFGPGH